MTWLRRLWRAIDDQHMPLRLIAEWLGVTTAFQFGIIVGVVIARG